MTTTYGTGAVVFQGGGRPILVDMGCLGDGVSGITHLTLSAALRLYGQLGEAIKDAEAEAL